MDEDVAKGFGSDNHCGVHPEIMNALIEANVGHAPSYGTDPITLRAQEKIQNLFSRELNCFFVFNGTAANTLALQALCDSFASVLCTDISHVNNDECGAPEKISGVKLIPVKSKNGKFIISELENHMTRQGDQHCSQVQAITITQPTEVGTVYSIEELTQLADFARKHSLRIHIDGARLNNAVAHMNSNHDLLCKNADIVSFGGTKNSLMFGEAVLVFNPELAKIFKYIRKQGLNLPSKSRFIGAQFERLLSDNLWKTIASHENQMAQKLKMILEKYPFAELAYPVESNAVFARIPAKIANIIRRKMFFYHWDRRSEIVRLMCSFDTTSKDIELFDQLLENYADEIY